MTNKNKIVDSWLVIRARTGDKKAFSLLVKRWHKKLCKQAYWYTKEKDSAKDIVQDCWPVIIKKIHSLKEPREFGSWALSIVTRRSLDALRKTTRDAKLFDGYKKDQSSAPSFDIPNEENNNIYMLRTAIKELPEASQIVLNLFYLEELSIREIGNILSISEGTIKSRLFNAREKLKTIMKIKNHEK